MLGAARYYQIEEYMSRRYLRWHFSRIARALPARASAVALVAISLAFVIPTHALAAAAAIIAPLAASLPARGSPVKKRLVRTARLQRLLFGACLCSIGAATLSYLVLRQLAMDARTVLFAATVLGYAHFILAPLWLVAGNALLRPIEALLRRRYLRQAAATLQSIQPKVVGITGSYGKTTTKTFLREFLRIRYHTYATPKSYNTLMGISLAINRDLAQDFRSEYFISEMGAYVEGEIARICQLTPPDIAIITEIGPQHLERFGSLDNVQAAKYELVKHLPPDGIAVFNVDNPRIRQMMERGYPATRLSVSRLLSPEQARVQGVTWLAEEVEQGLDGIRFRASHVESGMSIQIHTAVIGIHNVSNLLLCIALAHHEGIPLRDIALRARRLEAAESRLAIQRSAAGITIINDAYSANPKGVVSALEVLGMQPSQRRLLITPGMVELGELHAQENYKLGEHAARHATDIILVGREQTAAIYAALCDRDFPLERLQVVEHLQDALRWSKQHLRAGDAVLFLNDLPDTY